MALNSTKEPLTNGIAQQWKDALANMSSATATYLNCCKALEAFSILELASAKDIDTMIDVGLGEMDTLITQPLSLARSSLARTRNKTVSKINSIPPEILLHIFSFFIYNSQSTQSVRSTTIGIYRRLHTLVAVCSIWRRNCISCGSLWSLIPIFYGFPDPETLCNLSHAAGNSKLHLVAELGESARPDLNNILGQLTEGGQCFATIYLVCRTQLATRSVLEFFLDNPSSTLGSLTELSIYSKQPIPSIDTDIHPGESHYIFSRQSAYQGSFSRLVKSLRSLRIRGTHFHLANTEYLNLVELWLEQLDLGPIGTVRELVRSVSSASNLRIFRITTIITHQEHNNEEMLDIIPSFPYQRFSFPKLDRLHVEDVSFKVLKALLLSLKNGSDSYETILRLSECFGFVSQEDLEPLLRGINISTLILTRKSLCWNEINWLLECMPTLASLYIDGKTFNQTVLEGLVRPSGPDHNSVNHRPNLPVIRQLYITRARIDDLNGFRDFVASYPIDRMVLGARARKAHQGWDSCSEQSVTGRWLKEVLPGLEFVDPDLKPARTESVWQVWGPGMTCQS
ncbi:hypothetical protein ACGC1H_007679 [Rhizoctonia solani]